MRNNVNLDESEHIQINPMSGVCAQDRCVRVGGIAPIFVRRTLHDPLPLDRHVHRTLWTAVDRERRISMLSLSTPRIDADWAEVSIAICLSFSPTRSHRPAPKPSGPPWPPWPPIVIATATHMLPEITLWRGRRSHILLSTWVPEMGFLLSECELQAILLIHERSVTLG